MSKNEKVVLFETTLEDGGDFKVMSGEDDGKSHIYSKMMEMTLALGQDPNEVISDVITAMCQFCVRHARDATLMLPLLHKGIDVYMRMLVEEERQMEGPKQ